ncbi:flavin-containing monooxygenase [Thermoleophilum album]|uniref:Flavin-containing monooxygenase 5 n=1 Tax=Thermoleophilum album TaxID=29539 RepID=A0A1H6FHU5_THEAL|nr:NAD(P)-binding domain-containing protein [Thermoleophilum album]SEH10409.1 Predicted flavoprotein CzcO associated with the cation diffusion facilitator CzcD [Thermoleophilum album]
MGTTTPRVCIVGAGSSGIAACQVMQANDIDFDCFERGSNVGGNWRYDNDNGMSSAYKSLFINTSRRMMEYRSFPMPEDYPDYPHHTQIAKYFDDFVDHFGLRERITFRHEVQRVEPIDGAWQVKVRSIDTGETRTEVYDAVIVANGHHWLPRYPEPPFEGQDTFAGEQLHSHYYREPDERFVDRNVLVLGFGNSAVDIACESSRVSRITYLAMRRGAWVIPKYIEGKPVDQLQNEFTSRLPFRLQRWYLQRLIIKTQGRMEDYGLPKPDHKLGEAHPTISSELLPRIGHGRIKPKPNIARIEGRTVHFVDGTSEEVDTIVWCTGYQISFPFLPREVIDPKDNRVRLYRHVVHPDRPGLYFIGLVQPLGAIMPIAEAQSEWIADLLLGRCALPDRERMWREIERDERKMRKRYVASPRHTIQVDFYPYMRTIRRERRRRPRRRTSGAIAAPRLQTQGAQP